MTRPKLLATGETQGKCFHCRRRYVWKGEPRLRFARCPRCYRLLMRTTVYSGLPTTTDEPPRRIGDVCPWVPPASPDDYVIDVGLDEAADVCPWSPLNPHLEGEPV